MDSTDVISHIDEGKGDTVLFFVHGLGCSKNQWSHQIEYFSKKCRCIAIDLPGHGGTDRSEDFANIELFSEFIHDICNTLDLKNIILVGHSLGGLVCLKYAQDYPDSVNGVVLVDSSGDMRYEGKNEIGGFLQSLQSDTYEQAVTQYWQYLLKDATPETSDLTLHDLLQTTPSVFIDALSSVLDYDPVPSLNVFKKSMLCMVTQFNNFPHSLHNLREDMTVKKFERTSHWPQLDMPNEVNECIDQYLKCL